MTFDFKTRQPQLRVSAARITEVLQEASSPDSTPHSYLLPCICGSSMARLSLLRYYHFILFCFYFFALFLNFFKTSSSPCMCRLSVPSQSLLQQCVLYVTLIHDVALNKPNRRTFNSRSFV